MCCQRRGAEMSLVQLCQHFKEDLFGAVPSLWTHIHQPLTKLPQVSDDKEEGTGQIFIWSCVIRLVQGITRAWMSTGLAHYRFFFFGGGYCLAQTVVKESRL